VTRPRIALDLGGLDQLRPGAGQYRYVVDLIHALRDLRPPARFVVFGALPEPIDDLRPVFGPADRAWEYVHVPRATGRANYERDHVRLSAALARAGADLCHCLHYFVPALAPCPLVVTIQDMMYELFLGYEGAVTSRPYRVLRWLTRRRVRRAVCPSRTTADDLARLWGIPRRRIDVVPHGLRVFGTGADLPGGPASEYLRSLGEAPVVSSPLALEPRKNLTTLLEAFALIRPRFPAATLVLYGGGANRPAEREERYRADLARLGLTAPVVEPGMVSDADLWWLYRRSTLFVFPTLYEGFGYPALEAMAAGACPVVRGHSAMAEVVGEAGVQVEPLTPAALAEAMAGLLADEPRRRRLGEMARARAGLFTSERMARGTFATYTRALRLPRSPWSPERREPRPPGSGW
jgi:glycosyltransferase involved in cell wall biosynthesis